MPESVVRIRALHAAILVPREHPEPARVRDAVSGALTTHLRDALTSYFTGLKADSDQSVWLIRRLELETELHTRWDADGLAKAVARGVWLSLERELSCSDGVNALRFENRAAYLAHFLRERARGDAGQWYFQRFAGLRALPVSAALRSAVEQDLGVGFDALCDLAPGDRHAVIEALTGADATRLLECFGAGESDADLSSSMAALAAVCLQGVALSSTEVAREALELLVCARPDCATRVAMTRAAAAFAELRHGLAELNDDDRAAWLSALLRDDVRACVSLAPALAVGLTSLAACGKAARLVVCAALSREIGPEASTVGVSYSTPFGGIFLLLPELEALSIADLPLGEFEAITMPMPVLRAWVLASCLEPDAPARVLRDRVVRRVCNLTPELDAASLVVTLSAATLASVRALADLTLRRCASRLPGFVDSKSDYLRKNFLACSAIVDWEATRVVVRLGRPPLHVVLRLSGLLRRSYTLSWLAEVPVEVYPEE